MFFLLCIYSICDGFVNVFFMIVRCDAVKNYMFPRDSLSCKWLACNMGK